MTDSEHDKDPEPIKHVDAERVGSESESDSGSGSETPPPRDVEDGDQSGEHAEEAAGG